MSIKGSMDLRAPGSGGAGFLRATMARQWPLILLLSAASLLGGLGEAGVLVLATMVAVGISGGSSILTLPMVGSISTPTGLLLALSLLGVRFLLGIATIRASSTLVARVTLTERLRISRAFLGTRWSIQAAEPGGRLQELLTSYVDRVNSVATALATGVTAALSLASFLSAGAVVDPRATVAVLVVVLILGAALRPIRAKVRRGARDLAASNLAFAREVSELSALGQEMQVFGVSDAFADRVGGLAQENTKLRRNVQLASGLAPQVYVFLAYLAVLLGLAAIWASRLGAVSGLASVMLLMVRSLSYGQQLQSSLANMASSIPFLEKLDSIVAVYGLNPAPNGLLMPDGVGDVVVECVSYSYGGSRSALADVSFSIRAGEMVGIIGPSGSGKSTLAQILLGLREPEGGRVLVGADRVDLRDVDRKWLAKSIGFVSQQAALLTGTVAENMRFLRSGISDDVILDALESANLLADIAVLPLGVGTHLGERGTELSGGQRQRLSIGRALANTPQLLVLDEPTASLDMNSEGLIHKSLSALRGSTSLVVIAHRVGTLDDCDRILVLEDGRVTAFGSPAQLLQSSVYYQQVRRGDVM